MPKGLNADKIFEEFDQAVNRHLGFLVRDLAFERLATSVHPPECVATYVTDRARVSVLYEYLSSPWIQLAQKMASGRWQEAALESLAPKARKIVLANAAAPQGFDAVLEGKASVLRPLTAKLVAGNLDMKPAIVGEKKKVCDEALAILDRLQAVMGSGKTEASDQEYLTALRAALTSGRRARIAKLLDAQEQLKHTFNPRLMNNPASWSLVSDLTVAVQFCLQR